MLQRRLTISVGAALLLTACAGVDGTERGAIRENVVEPGITAIGEARGESCGLNASTMRTAIDAYSLLIGEPPPDEAALVEEGFLRSPMDDWDVVDGVIVAQNPACGDVPAAVPADEIVTDPGDDAGFTPDEVLATFSDAEIDEFGGVECARQIAVITAGANLYFTNEGVEPETIDDLERAGHLAEPVTMWQVIDDELRPTDGSPCPDFMATASAGSASSALDECDAGRRTLEVAVEAHLAQHGEYPSSEKDLVTRGFLREVSDDFDLAANGLVVVAAGSACR